MYKNQSVRFISNDMDLLEKEATIMGISRSALIRMILRKWLMYKGLIRFD